MFLHQVAATGHGNGSSFACERIIATLRGGSMPSGLTFENVPAQKGETMRYVLLIVGALVAFDVTPARADTISLAVNNATMFMSPNVGGGDHIFFRFTGTGVKIEGIGGMACFEWC